ncbi:Glucan endo-1,3-beta-glucosidase, acidic isoform GL153 [Camellia lanceoleosa]|uniref:Glucan endo-1,3-beta-glucosidase, acidic isoform GL153 n=1 Tax=Camellia lanceoleosa TaxID=1840588 RepID=A0ACC0FSP0_9ERIC|nr:Glucan endo-1,3-beta-glucosidase, acidic isoform GL153 [Camellia lanceoleosa]
MYGPKSSTFETLRGSNIELVLDVPNSNLSALGFDPLATSQWVQNNVGNYFPGVKFWYIAVGNEVDPNKANTAPYVQFVLPAMKNDQIKVSTATYSALVSNPYPPSQGSFDGVVKSFMEPTIQFLAANKSPLLANIYPYFAYTGDPQHNTLPYVLFTGSGDPSGYQNLFDAMLDAMYSAVEKAGGPGVEIVVSETGWPSQGHEGATKQNAETYYQNMIKHVKAGSGTPKRPGKAIEVYLFAMFDENKKTGEETERNFGLFYPQQTAQVPYYF